MRNKFVTNSILGAYNLVQKSGILEVGPVQRAFLAASFLYKRHYEDPFWALAQRNPELFRSGDILKSLQYLNRALAMQEAAGNKAAMATTLDELASDFAYIGQQDRALD